MEPETRKMLNQIDNFLARSDRAASELWAVLAALRGPDVPGSSHLKSSTTCTIRRAAFPKLASVINENYDWPGRCRPWPGDPENLKSFDIPEVDASHFADHAREAAKVLGL